MALRYPLDCCSLRVQPMNLQSRNSGLELISAGLLNLKQGDINCIIMKVKNANARS